MALERNRRPVSAQQRRSTKGLSRRKNHGKDGAGPVKTPVSQGLDAAPIGADGEEQSELPDLGGRPFEIDDAQLLSNRDCWIGLLSNAWIEIGWLLTRARSREDIRKVFASIRNVAAHEHVFLAPFIRETSIDATAAEVRATRNQLKALREREYLLIYDRYTLRNQTLTERMRESKDALRMAWRSDDRQRKELRDEHLRRVRELATFRKDSKELRQRCTALERVLDEQEASFAQQELCTFIRRGKYPCTPRRLARVMAGLPYIGSEQSNRRCSEHSENTLRHSQFQVFEVIEKAWKQRTDRSKSAFLKRIEKQVRTLRTTDKKGDPDHHAIGVRSHFVENWRYLNEAIKALDVLAVAPGSVPYLIASDFRQRVTQATPTQRVKASLEQLQPVIAARPKRRRKPTKD